MPISTRQENSISKPMKLKGLILALVLWQGPSMAIAQSNPPSAPTVQETEAIKSAESLLDQGVKAYYKKQYDKAETLYRQSLEKYRQASGNRHPKIAAILNNLAILYWDQSLYGKAESSFRQVLQLRQQQYGDRHPQIADILHNIAVLKDQQGQYNQAQPYYLQSQKIYREQYGDHHPDVAMSLDALAGSYTYQGKYSQAEPLVLQSLEMFRKQFGNSHPDVANRLKNLARIYLHQGRYGEAEPLLVEALGILQSSLSKEHPNIASTLYLLGNLYSDQKQDGIAQDFYLRAVNIYRLHPVEEASNLAISLEGLANLYQRINRFERSYDLHSEALNIRRQVLGKNHPEVAASLFNLAIIQEKQGYFTLSTDEENQAYFNQAKSLYQDALKIWRQQLGDRHPLVAHAHMALANISQLLNTPSESLDYFEQGLNVEEWNLDQNLSHLAEPQRQSYIRKVSPTTHQVISFHQHILPENAKASQLALTTILRRKGRLLDVGTDSLSILRQNLSPKNQALFDEWVSTRQQIANLTFNTVPKGKRALEDLEAKANELELELARRSALFRTESQPLAIHKIQAQIPSNGVLVEFIRYQPYEPLSNRSENPEYVAYLLFPNGDIKSQYLGNAEIIDEAIQRFSLHLRDKSIPIHNRRTRDLETLILDPITAMLSGQEHLLISPDSQLNRIPFEALRQDNGNYLVEQYQISYLNSGRDLLKVKRTISKQNLNPPVIIANPDYKKTHQNGEIASARSASQRSSTLKDLTFQPLPGTAKEAESISRLLPNAQIWVSQDATENRIKSLTAPQILHIATHGFFLPNTQRFPDFNFGLRAFLPTSFSTDPWQGNLSHVSENPLLRSGLALAGFNARQSGHEDGVLTALEASTLNLFGTQLVVLSACETGLGDIENGEGVYGLRRAFAIAGAETQLISLWHVDDAATQELMTQYYKKLSNGQGRSEALRQSQLEMIQSDSHYAHPYYWSAFITSGNWKPLQE